jgi:hypothetical protein
MHAATDCEGSQPPFATCSSHPDRKRFGGGATVIDNTTGARRAGQDRNAPSAARVVLTRPSAPAQSELERRRYPSAREQLVLRSCQDSAPECRGRHWNRQSRAGIARRRLVHALSVSRAVPFPQVREWHRQVGEINCRADRMIGRMHGRDLEASQPVRRRACRATCKRPCTRTCA